MKAAFFRLGLVLAALISLGGISAKAQGVCTADVYDGAGVLGGQTASVQAAVRDLDSKGADAHAITYSGLTGATLDQTVMNTVRSCPAFQSPNGGVKSTLVILAVAPGARKMGIYAGHAFDGAFTAADTNRYRTEFMAPHFRAGEWAAGLTAAADQMSQRLAAFNSEANAPVTNTTTVVNQAEAPTDYSGLWIFLWILAGLGVVGAGLLIFFYFRKEEEERKNAQASAVAYRNEAASLVTELTGTLSSADATLPGTKAAQALFDTHSAAYTRLAQTLSGDPSDDKLTKTAYVSLAQQYRAIVRNLRLAESYLKTPALDPSTFTPIDADDPTKGYTIPQQQTAAAAAGAGTTVGAPAPAPQTVVVQSSTDSGDLALGMIIGSELSRGDRYEREDYSGGSIDSGDTGFSPGSGSSETGSSSDDDGGFGSSSGSSDFGSSDSGSSWSDSSSSSSDFGGGGGGDFGGSSGGDGF